MVRPLAAITLANDAFTAINLGTLRVETVILQCRSAIDVKFSDVSAGTNYFTIKSGQSLAVDVSGKSGIIGYAEAASSTPALEVLMVF